MTTLLVIFWATLIFVSIAWYGVLVFYVGAKAGKEVRELTKSLAREDDGHLRGPDT
jgi:hypothetical protein